MSKRPRAARPNKRPRSHSPAVTRPAAATVPVAAVAAVEAAEAGESALPVAAAGPRAASARLQPRASSKPSGLLAQKAANEYVYVARDLRRIGAFAGAVAAFLALVWVLVDLMHVVAV